MNHDLENKEDSEGQIFTWKKNKKKTGHIENFENFWEHEGQILLE